MNPLEVLGLITGLVLLAIVVAVVWDRLQERKVDRDELLTTVAAARMAVREAQRKVDEASL